jgi:hypothetical protein
VLSQRAKNAKECESSGLDANRTYASNISAKPDTKLEIKERTKPYALYVRSCLPTFRDSSSVPSPTIKKVSISGSKLYFVLLLMSVSKGEEFFRRNNMLIVQIIM